MRLLLQKVGIPSTDTKNCLYQSIAYFILYISIMISSLTDYYEECTVDCRRVGQLRNPGNYRRCVNTFDSHCTLSGSAFPARHRPIT